MKDNPSEIRKIVAHSKASSVVDRWMENHPEFTGRARLCATPHIDVIGSEKFKDYLNQTKQIRHDFYTQNFWGPSWLGKVTEDFENKRQDLFEWWTSFDKVKGMEEKHQLRNTNQMDMVAIFDASAKEFNDPTWLRWLVSGLRRTWVYRQRA
jgi:hypothetical protein